MLLASQVAGALLAGLLVYVLARAADLTGRQATACVAVTSIVIASFLSLPALRDAIETMSEERRGNSPLSEEERRLLPGRFAEVDVVFAGWVKERLAPGETFELQVGEEVGPDAAGLDLQWISFQLAPHLAVARPIRPDRVVFYDVPKYRYLLGSSYTEVDVYSPGYAIARPADAG